MGWCDIFKILNIIFRQLIGRVQRRPDHFQLVVIHCVVAVYVGRIVRVSIHPYIVSVIGNRVKVNIFKTKG